MRDGPQPDVFLVGLAILGLLADTAREEPLLCVIDDAQWLDRASAQAVALAGRRLQADSVALLFSLREPSERDEFANLPELRLEGLSDADALELLASVVTGRLDDRVAARLVAEAQGNPLALLELPRTSTPADMAGGFALAAAPLSSRLEAGFLQRAAQLPPQTQRLLLLAAAEPVGDAAVLWRAAAILGIAADDAAAPAEDEGLLDPGPPVRFRHPLVRSALYRAASASERRRVHAALGEATEPSLDPDRRAWHLAQAASGPDERIADDLERSASRARARGGVAAAAAFLERSTALTVAPERRAERALAAAEAKHEAGAPRTAVDLVAFAESGPLDELQRARAERIRAQVAFAEGRGSDAVRLLVMTAARLERLDPALAGSTYLEALWAAWQGGSLAELRPVAEAITRRATSDEQRSATELLLMGYARLYLEGFPAGTDLLKQAMQMLRNEPLTEESDLHGLGFACRIARALWDDENWSALSLRWVRLARDAGALTMLSRALEWLGSFQTNSGDLVSAATTREEQRAISDATGCVLTGTDALLVALHAEQGRALEDVDATLHEAIRTDNDLATMEAQWALATLCNSLGHYREALVAAQASCSRHPWRGVGIVFTELIEAACRSGEAAVANETLQSLVELTRLGDTDFALGMEARSRALTSEGSTAEELYREAIWRLGRTRMKLHLARAHLLYGEWLRRQQRPTDARDQLRTALELFDAMGVPSFAGRATAELRATGERVRASKHRASVELTAQEAAVARLASEGLTNQEIAAQLFLSAYTVDYHLRKVFRKLDIDGRGQLNRSLLDHVISPTVAHDGRGIRANDSARRDRSKA